MNRRRWNSLQKNIKDYIVPIIWVFLILILIISFFRWWDNETPNVENQNWIKISMDNDFSDAVIEYSWGNRVDYEGDTDLYKWEKIIVRDWKVSLNSEDLGLDFKIDKLWEIKYLENGGFSHTSWEVWLNTTKPVDVSMNFAKLKIWENSHLSLSQNEVSSTVYLLSGFLEINNLVWRNTVLTSWEKISISRSEASDNSIDLSLNKDSLDQFFLRSDWYILNNWDSYIESSLENEETSSGSVDTENNNQTILWWNNYLTFSNLIDESNVSSSSIDINWNYNMDVVYDFSVNWKKAELDSSNWTFKVTWVDTSKSVNDLIFKVYNESNWLVSKFIYTVYYSEWTSSSWNQSNSWFNVKTYDVDWTDYKFTSPSTNNSYTTTETFVTIRGAVSDDRIDKVTVNWYELSSFNWNTWRYHADVDYNNLADWTNVYEVKYFSGEEVIYTNYYTIIKRSNNTSWIISWETDV